MEKIYLGDEPIARVYHQGELTYPNPVKDGLVLWYDFMGRQNSDARRDVAVDLSGNGNDGELANFAYDEGSGYERGLAFDGVDDYIGEVQNPIVETHSKAHTVSFVIEVLEDKRNNLFYAIEETKIDVYGDGLRRNGHGLEIKVSCDMLFKTVYVTFVLDEESHKTYIDGVLYQEDTYDESALPDFKIHNIGFYVPYGRPNVNLFSMQIYNRALTPEEIQHNYQMEKARWNL